MSPRLLLLAAILTLSLPACSDEPAAGNDKTSREPSSSADDDGNDDGDAADDGSGADDDDSKGDVGAARDAGAAKPKPSVMDASSARVDAGKPGNTPAVDPGDAGASATDDGGAFADAQAGSATGACDRPCLIGFMQTYLDALVARDPGKLKVASSLKYTDNGVVAKLGDGLWKTASALVKNARLDFADVTAGQVATHTVVNENGTTPVIYMVRLKVAEQTITEIESMTVRRQGAANGFFDPSKLVPEPAFLKPVEPEKRMTRDAMNAVTELYLDYLEGKKKAADVGFDMGCKRYENGTVTANGLSAFNGQNFWSFHVTRRTLIIDEEAGITWGMYPFEQSATALVVGEAFKIVEGKIMMIQAVMASQPTTAWK